MTDDEINLALGIEPIPADCLPPQHVIDAVLRGPAMDADGVITEGTYQGKTWAQVRREAEAWDRMF